MILAVQNILVGMANSPIPPADPLGYPAPFFLLQALAYLTLTLHFLAMNFTVGGLLILVTVQKKSGAEFELTGRFFKHALPLGFSYLVTFGVPPLLFLQVLYGQLIYSSSVLIGLFWISIVPLLLLAYALLYANKFGHENSPRMRNLLLHLSLIAMLCVGFILVNNITLSMVPGRWAEMYSHSPGGAQLNLTEPTLVPRFLLVIFPSLLVGGLSLMLAGAVLPNVAGEPTSAAKIRRLGRNFYFIGRLLLCLVAIWMIGTLPSHLRTQLFSGGIFAVLLGIGVLAAVLGSALTWLAEKSGLVSHSIISAIVLTAEIFSFVALRDQLRIAYLDGYFDLFAVPVHAQWEMLGVFLVTLVVGLTLIAFLTVAVVKNLLSPNVSKSTGS